MNSFEVTRVGRASVPVGRAIQLYLLAQFQKLADIATGLDHEDEATAAEAVHDFRVTCQQMRSVLNSFSAYLPRKPIIRLIRDIRKLQKSLGEARDIHILLSQEELVLGLRQELEAKVQELMAKHAEKASDKTISSQIARICQRDVDPEDELKLGGEPLSKKGVVLLRRLDAIIPAVLYAQAAAITAYKPFLPTNRQEWPAAAGETAAAGITRFWTEPYWPSADVMHRLRLEFKQLRHTLMMLSNYWGEIGDDLTRSCNEMQDTLGYLNDRRVFATAMFNYWRQNPADTSVPAVWPQLRESQADAVDAFLKSWRQLDFNWFQEQLQPLVSWCADQVSYDNC
ncbi:MAG: CHAD domain-containing protein [Ruminococcaceae bacterium]|nr:CHAD domain-containing protein [Oscillospiraceae bacterium]